MTVVEKLNDMIKESMKTKNPNLGLLRMIKTEVVKKETAANGKEVDESTYIALLHTMSKQRTESISAFVKGNRQDLVLKEQFELEQLRNLLPKQLNPDELRGIVVETATEIGATEIRDMGKTIKAVLEKVNGQASGKDVSTYVKAYLQSL